MRLPGRDHEKIRWAALMWGANLGPVSFRRLLGHFGSAQALVEADDASLRLPSLRLDSEQIHVIRGLAKRLDEFEAQIADLEAEGIAVLCEWETGYPELLRDLRNRPPVICMAGTLLPQDRNAMTIVGTRTPTQAGYEMARSLARAFARVGTTVVSGLARGCDTAAHIGALEEEGRTVAVLGSGIRQVHPRANLDLARRISQHGAVISEQPPGAHPTVGRLMARNRLLSALARGVLVVQAREEGGALETARRAVEQHRLVYAVHWPERIEESRGPDRLLAEGARPVRGPEDVPAIQLELADHLTRIQRAIHDRQAQGTLFGPDLYHNGEAKT